jgi:hypothetical protein
MGRVGVERRRRGAQIEDARVEQDAGHIRTVDIDRDQFHGFRFLPNFSLTASLI